MWIYLPDAFLSIVAHRTEPEYLLVRARFAGDLERVFPGCEVQVTPDADYRFRALVSRVRAADVIAANVAGIEYDNVKGAVPSGGVIDNLRYSAMTRAHAALCSAQEAAAE